MANVAPKINYPDQIIRLIPVVALPNASFAGKPSGDAGYPVENYAHSFGPGVGRNPITPPVVQFAASIVPR